MRAEYKVPTRFNKTKLRELEQFDVIRQRFKEPAKEELFTRSLQRGLADTLRMSMEKRRRGDRGFHILSNRPNSAARPSDLAPRRSDPREVSKHMTRVGYNIVNHVDRRSGRVEPVPPPRRYNLRTQKDYRVFDIVSNRYVERHSDQVSADQDAERSRALRKYVKDRDFDHVAIRYVDPDKEAKYLADRDTKLAEMNAKQLLRLPLSYKRSEGRMYDIVSGEVIQPDALAHHNHLLARRDKLHKRNYATEKQQRQRGIEIQDIREAQKHNRISAARYSRTLSRGYDIVNQKKIKKLKTHPKKRVSVYEAMKLDRKGALFS